MKGFTFVNPGYLRMGLLSDLTVLALIFQCYSFHFNISNVVCFTNVLGVTRF